MAFVHKQVPFVEMGLCLEGSEILATTCLLMLRLLHLPHTLYDGGALGETLSPDRKRGHPKQQQCTKQPHQKGEGGRPLVGKGGNEASERNGLLASPSLPPPSTSWFQEQADAQQGLTQAAAPATPLEEDPTEKQQPSGQFQPSPPCYA